MAWMLGNDDEAIATASPLKNVSGNEPPFLILYASKDFPSCDKMSNEMCAALKQKKVEVTVQEIADRTHVSIMFRMMLNEADPTTQAVLKFIAKHSGMTLKPRNVKD
jgi:acetyl esterase/lipase